MSDLATLTKDDLTRLIGDDPVAAQTDVVNKLSAHYNAEGNKAMTNEQSQLANDIFALLLNRADAQVRATIAFNLKQSDKIPADIAIKMANDINDVALPILQFSHVLSENDLLNIIKTANDHEKLMAVASREEVTELVADALVETHIEKVVSTLVHNEGAHIADNTYGKIIKNHTDSLMVMDAMLERGSLPIAIVEKLVAQVSHNIRQNLESKFGNLVELKELRKMVDNSIELTNLKLLGLKASDAEIMRLISHLEKNGILQPFSALCMANLQLFEVSISRILRLPYVHVHKIMQSEGGLKALYLKAELPESMFDAVELCIQAIQILEKEESTSAKALLSPYQVMSQMIKMAKGREVDNVDYMYRMLQQNTRDNIRYQTGSD